MANESDSVTSNPNPTHNPTPNPSQTPVTPLMNMPKSGTILITDHKLTGHNFNQWSHSVMIVICGKGKEDYLIGAAIPPEENNPNFRLWKAENNMVISWLLNSITNETRENFMYDKTAKGDLGCSKGDLLE